jgi:hypothetical protein
MEMGSILGSDERPEKLPVVYAFVPSGVSPLFEVIPILVTYHRISVYQVVVSQHSGLSSSRDLASTR